MSTKDQVIAKFRRRYPGATPTVAGEIFDDVHKSIINRTQVRNTTITLNVSDGIREYDLDTKIVKIYDVYYYESATVYWRLEPVNPDLLDMQADTWRARTDESAPRQYYTQSAPSSTGAKAMIGFIAIPPTTTAAGYPIVHIFCAAHEALTGAQNVPTNLLNDRVYVEMMKAIYAADHDLKNVAAYNQLAQIELDKNIAFVKNMQTRELTEIRINMPSNSYI